MADIGNWTGNAWVCHILSKWIQLEMTFLTNLKLKKIVWYHKIRNEWPEVAHFLFNFDALWCPKPTKYGPEFLKIALRCLVWLCSSTCSGFMVKRTTLIWDKVYGFSSYQYLKTFLSFSSHLIFVLVLVSCSHPAQLERETRKKKKLSERKRKRLIYFETVKNNNLILQPTCIKQGAFLLLESSRINRELQELMFVWISGTN